MTDERDDEPQRGTPEYDRRMAELYQRQLRPHPEGVSTESEFREVSTPGGPVYIHRTSDVPTETEWTEGSARQAADRGQLYTIARDIQRIEAELAEVRGYGQSGEPLPKYQGEHRRQRELTLRQLQHEVPYIERRMKDAQAWLAANVPTAEEKLLAERDRQEAIRKRAEEIADEAEARELAARKRPGIGIGRA